MSEETPFKGIQVIPCKTFIPEEEKEFEESIPDYLEYYVVVDFNRLKDHSNDEVLVIRNDSKGEWWVTNAFLEVVLVHDMDAPEMTEHTLAGPFNKFDDAVHTATLYKMAAPE